MDKVNRLLLIAIMLGGILTARAGDADSVASADSASTDSIAAPKPGFFKRVIQSLTEGNVDRTHERAIDISFVAYPSYSHEPGFGLGGALTALYRIDRTDSIMPPSDCFLSFNASLRGFFQIYIKGNNLFPNGRSRLNYVVELYRKPLEFYGILVSEIAKNPQSKYDRYMVDIQANFSHEIVENLYIGARLRSDFTAATRMQNPEYLLGEKHLYFVNGIGPLIEYDTRDDLLNPSHGIHVLYHAAFYPKFLGNASAPFLNQTCIANYYTRLWRDAILGTDLYGSFNTHHTPWSMREMVAADGMRMRGYYMGSYMDNNQIAFQAEVRQHVYKRLGFTLWGGVATLFNDFNDFHSGGSKPRWLPNYGIGLRFEIKHNANVRLDCGFGRNGMGILFAFGEAF